MPKREPLGFEFFFLFEHSVIVSDFDIRASDFFPTAGRADPDVTL